MHPPGQKPDNDCMNFLCSAIDACLKFHDPICFWSVMQMRMCIEKTKHSGDNLAARLRDFSLCDAISFRPDRFIPFCGVFFSFFFSLLTPLHRLAHYWQSEQAAMVTMRCVTVCKAAEQHSLPMSPSTPRQCTVKVKEQHYIILLSRWAVLLKGHGEHLKAELLMILLSNEKYCICFGKSENGK